MWSLGDDAAMLDIVTSANVACGFHAGDPAGLLRVCHAAAARGVRIGAQVGYRDLAGFGRRFIDVDPLDLTADVIYQIGALSALALAAGTAVSYVKPHGALYNTIVDHRSIRPGRSPRRYTPSIRRCRCWASADPAFFTAAEDLGLRTVSEAFADRAYRPDGRLVSRREPGAVLSDADEIADRVVLTMVTQGRGHGRGRNEHRGPPGIGVCTRGFARRGGDRRCGGVRQRLDSRRCHSGTARRASSIVRPGFISLLAE